MAIASSATAQVFSMCVPPFSCYALKLYASSKVPGNGPVRWCDFANYPDQHLGYIILRSSKRMYSFAMLQSSPLRR
jgi:hypothetical protein